MSAAILGVIPARYASTRFPGKPLVEIHGKSMIQRVYEQAQKAHCLGQVIVATDDQRIFDHVQQFGGLVEMTPSDVPSGTERVALVAQKYPQYNYVINIQGDEPYIDPRQIDLLGETLTGENGLAIATLVKPIHEASMLTDPKFVKVVLRNDRYAMYFSRSPIPHYRNSTRPEDWLQLASYYKHIGIYGFPREVLLKIPSLVPVEAEKAESLEQLRWLGHGIPIKVALTEQETVAVDTPGDLQRLEQLEKDDPG